MLLGSSAVAEPMVHMTAHILSLLSRLLREPTPLAGNREFKCDAKAMICDLVLIVS